MKYLNILMIASCAFIIGRASPAAETSIQSPAPSGILSLAQPQPLVPEMVERHSEAVSKMLVAITKVDFRGFLFEGDKRFQAFDQAKFEELCRSWGGRLSSGFAVTYLTELKRPKAFSTVWRVRMNDKSGDVLVILETNSRGSVSGFAVN